MKQNAGNIFNSNVSGLNVSGNKNTISNGTKSSNNKWSILLSIIAIVLSLSVGILLFLTVKDECTTTNDSFIGAIGGLMSICTTIIVGFQIYNFVDINKKIQDSNNSYNNNINQLLSQQQKLETLVANTKNDFEKSKQYNQRQIYILQSYIRIVQAITISEKQPFSAFYSWYFAMKYAIEANDDKIINLIMDNLEKLYKDIESFDNKTIADYIKNDDNENIKYAKSIKLENMPTSDTYRDVQDRFEKIVSDIIRKISN